MAEKVHHPVAERRRGARFCGYGKEKVNEAFPARQGASPQSIIATRAAHDWL
jgi:hypothetical protein